jgi:glycosyltransferase involved in cell wall biosynthesis
MKILQYITPARLGGAEMHVLALSAELVRRGHQVTVLCPRGRPLVPELARAGLPYLAPRTMGKVDPVTLLRVAGWLRRGRYQVLHTHLSTASLLGSLAGRLAGVPVVATVHGFNAAFSFRGCPRLVAVSQAVREHLLRQGIPPPRVRVICNGISLPVPADPAAVATVREQIGVPPGGLLAGSLGRLRPEKGHRYLVEAMARLGERVDLPPLSLLLVGEGTEAGALQAQVERLGLAGRVHFAGFQRDIAPYLAAMDIFVLPSLREGLSISALEAMALRRPVVASRVGGTPEVVEEGKSGMLVPPADPESLAKAIAELIADPARAAAMGQAGRARVEANFTLEHMVSQLEHLYREAAAS